MTGSSPVFKGVIHGKVIELDREPGLPEGQEVAVTVEPIATPKPPMPSARLPEGIRRQWEDAWVEVKDLPPGEGLRRAFGAWADDAQEVDQFLEWTRAQRHQDRRPPDL